MDPATLERVIMVNTILASPSRLHHYADMHGITIWQARERLVAMLNPYWKEVAKE